MQKDIISTYLDEVTSKILWKRARKPISAELAAHISDKKEEFIAGGMSEDEAAAFAIQEMGNPTEVGEELNRLHRPKFNFIIVTFFVMMVMVGIINIVAMTNGKSFNHTPFAAFIIGLICFTLFYFIDFTIMAKHAFKFFISVSIITVLLFISDGSIYLISIRNYMFLFFPLVLAALIYKMQGFKLIGTIISGVVFSFQSALVLLLSPRNASPVVMLSGAILLIASAASNHYDIKRKSRIVLSVFITLMIFITSIAIIPRVFPNLYYSSYVLYKNQASISSYIQVITIEILSKARLLGS